MTDLLFIPLSGLLLAQAGSPAASSPDNIKLEPLTVTSSRQVGEPEKAPLSRSVIKVDTLDRSRQLQEFSTLLQGVPGVFVQNRQNFAQDARIAVRGFGARASFGIRGLEIRQDGIPLSLPDGQGQVDSIPPNLIEQLQVLRGPAAIQYGNAAGGAVLLETLDGADPGADRISLQVGSDHFRNALACHGQAWNSGDAFVAVSEISTDGYREHAEANSRQGLAKFNQRIGDGMELRVLAQATDAPQSNDPGGLTWTQVLSDPEQARSANVQFDGGEQLDQQLLGASLLSEQSNTNWRLTGFHQQRDFENRLPFTNGGAVVIDRRFNGLSGELRWAAITTIELLTGFDIESFEDQRKRFDNNAGRRGALRLDQDESADSQGLFALFNWDMADRWVVQAGVRHDRLELSVEDGFLVDGDDSGERDFSETTWHAGISWQPISDHVLYLNLGESFESPTFTELANPAGGGFNSTLAPQDADSLEIGWRARWATWQMELVGFELDIDNELLPFEREDQPGRTFFRNAGASSRRGVEWLIDGSLADTVDLSLSWTWSDFKFEGQGGRAALAGNRLPGIPEHQVHAELAWTPVRNAGLALSGTYTGRVWADDENDNSAPAQTRLDLRGFYQWEGGDQLWRLSGGVENLGDELLIDNVRLNAFGDRYFEPAPGRRWHLGLTLLY